MAHAEPSPATTRAAPATSEPVAVASAATQPAAALDDGAPPPPPSAPATRPSLADASPAAPTTAPARPPLRPALRTADDLLDAKVGEAIERAQRSVLGHFSAATYQLFDLQSDYPRLGKSDNGSPCGLNALAVYALMQAGLSTHDSRLKPTAPMMRGLIDGMKRLPATTGKAVYARGIRATALALFNRPEDHAALQDDVTYLIRLQNHGGYSYPAPLYPESFDNSNSQYGLLGVWSGAEAGIEVPQEYWAQVENHWTRTQLADGRWGYQHLNPSLPMTAAGIASTFVAHQWLEFPVFRGDVGREPFSPTLEAALRWWETGNNYVVVGAGNTMPAHFGYTVYGIERVGLASGFKFFGTHEWYREMATQLVARQQRDGAWGDVIDTSYILIFLARGRHPVLMNKLRFDHTPGMNNRYWDNRPLDMNHLASWSGHELERPLNWQIVNLERDWPDWMDAPVLYFASHRPLKFTEADYAKMRHYVEAGGMIFTQADGDGESFTRFVAELAKKLFPNYEFQDVPPSHPIYSVDYDLKGSPPLKMVSNGSRILLLHSPKDISRYWETRDDKLHKKLFQLGLNISLYAGGKNDLRNKLATTYVPEPPPPPKGAPVIKVLRLMYNGNWDPEPGAWERYRRVFQNATGTGIDLDATQLKDLRAGMAPFAHLTGTAAYELTTDESVALRNFVEQGGVVLVDACGGSGPFAESIRKSLAGAFAPATLARIPPGHPMLQPGPPGMADLSKPLFRQFVLDKVGPRFAGGLEILKAGQGHVIFSQLDLTSGLLGTNTWAIWGFAPSYAQSSMQNLIFWTIDGQRENAVAAQ